VIHHVSVETGDLAASGAFYDAVLGALGWRRQGDDAEMISWGIVRPVFFVCLGRSGGDPAGGHVCFAASGIPAVKAAWEGGLEAGGADDGAPGPRPEYGANHYAAYMRDPDGNRVEVAVGTS
jgi:catechol 2,3-dioxygenase-like lactoylglutathione lyase family enzyme